MADKNSEIIIIYTISKTCQPVYVLRDRCLQIQIKRRYRKGISDKTEIPFLLSLQE